VKFKLEITLSTPEMDDQHDVAAALRDIATQLDRQVSSGWSPYALSGKIRDRAKSVVGRWEVEPDGEIALLHEVEP